MKHQVRTFIQSGGVKNIEEHLSLLQVCVDYMSNVILHTHQESADFSVKGQVVHIFGSVGHTSSSQLLSSGFNVKAAQTVRNE